MRQTDPEKSNKVKFESKIKGVLLDIEGTTSSISYVYDVLFPYARAEIANYLRATWDDAKTQHAVGSLAKDLGHSNARQWLFEANISADADGTSTFQKIIEDQVNRLMDQDLKATGLKELQGLIWNVGYNEGKLCSHVYDDVPVAMKVWNNAGIDTRIYSSGSINAQKVFFRHTEYGDLSSLLRGYYDTTIGSKKESNSYKSIASDFGLDPASILFLSDIPAELEAAQGAGMEVAIVRRPGNVAGANSFQSVDSFAQIELEK